MKPEELARIGQAIFGPNWQTPLADGLGVGRRSVRRWALDGAPAAMGPRISSLCLLRAANLIRISIELTRGKP